VNRKSVFLILAGLMIGAGLGMLILLSLGTNLSPEGKDSPPSQGLAVPHGGYTAPDFELFTLSGERIRLSNLQGKSVLLNFWATWCGPCRLEMPSIQKRYEQYAPDLAVLAINFDEPQEIVQQFVSELGLTFDILLDPGGEIQQLYRVMGYPTSYFVDAQGIVRIHHVGYMSETQLDEYLTAMGVGQ
jgi:peroxiredoxin